MIKRIIRGIGIVLLSIGLILLYSRFVATSGLRTNEIVVNVSDISDDFDGLKIVHFSDLHYKRIISKKRISALIDEINLINPDIIVFTGDLIDEDSDIGTEELDYLKEVLSGINCKYGKYAVLGNHDYSIDITDIKDVYVKSGFVLLNNSYDIIYSKNNEKLYIGGINTEEYNESVLGELITGEEDIYKIVLLHKPDYIEEILSLTPNLVLGGHSHNGQVNIPYVKNLFLPEGSTKYYKGYYKVGNSEFYISNGIGVSKYNFRLFNTPSINFYRLNKKRDLVKSSV